MILIPEIKILAIVDSCIKVIEQDLAANTLTPNDSLLYKILGTNQVGRYNFFNEAKDIFTRDHNHPRKIETRMMFDAQRAHLPTIHISMPNEQTGSMDGIGLDEGYIDNELNVSTGKYKKYFTRSFDTNYNCIITSDNSLEVLCIYHVIKALFISIFQTIEFEGIRNIKFSGQDLQIQTDMIPAHIFTRGLGISCVYEQSVPEALQNNLVTKFKFEWVNTCNL